MLPDSASIPKFYSANVQKDRNCVDKCIIRIAGFSNSQILKKLGTFVSYHKAGPVKINSLFNLLLND